MSDQWTGEPIPERNAATDRYESVTAGDVSAGQYGHRAGRETPTDRYGYDTERLPGRRGRGMPDIDVEDWTPLLIGLGVGAGLLYLLSGERGEGRRTYLRDQAVHTGRKVAEGVGGKARHLRNRARGAVAEMAGRFRQEQVTDDVLVARIRSEMGRVVSHPRAVQVHARHGDVILTGEILADEEDRLLETICHVPGVQRVESRLDCYCESGSVPSLQGEGRRTRMEQDNGSGRMMTMLAGTALSLLGAELLRRAATMAPPAHETPVGIGRRFRGIDFQTTINIHAPVEEVFAFCSRWENFPRFMDHVREVRGDGQRSHWVVDGPAGVPATWDALVTDFVPNRLLAWRSVPGSMVEQAGMMRFDENLDGTTRIHIRMSYNPPAGRLGHAVATLFRAHPERQMEEDFNRLKSLLEAGKTTTRDGEVTRGDVAA